MVLSGEGGITLAPERADLYAKLQVDGAYIDFSRLRGARSLPSDVVVVRAEQPSKAETRRLMSRSIFAAISAIASTFAARVSKRGLTARSTSRGARASCWPKAMCEHAAAPIRATGSACRFERGILTFQGPVENPALNVLAVRTGLPVDVGVSIGGTAARPIVRLYSDPSMTDVEKLNWLVLGRPPAQRVTVVRSARCCRRLPARFSQARCDSAAPA